jgi:hypothetical protein
MRHVPCVRSVGVVAVLVFGSSGGGHAAAFLDPPGRGEVIVTTSFSDSANAFDASGKLVPVASYRKFELTAWTDYGLTDWLTLIVVPSADDIIDAGHPASTYRGLGMTEAGVRVPVVQSGSTILSVQVTGLVPGSFDKTNPALAGYNSFESDARLLYGASFALAGLSSFIDVEAGYRWHEIGPGEVRADLTFGLRPIANILLLAQSFNILSVGPGVAYAPNLRSDKLETSAVYDFTKAWSAQLGAFATVAAVNARRERGVVTAVWYRF